MSAVSATWLRLPRWRKEAPGTIKSVWRQPLAIAGFAIVLVWVVLAIFAPLIAPYSPIEQTTEITQPPSGSHLFGTDELGRDILSRVIYGARITIPYSFLLVVLAMAVGGVLGAIAGYFRSWADGLIMRMVDLTFAFPPIILAMVVSAVLGPSVRNAVLAVVVVAWPTYARLVRGLVLSVGASEYVWSSRLLGASSARALVKDVLPNIVGPVIVYATLDLGQAVLILSALSFLGLGAQAPAAEWGAMVSTGAQQFQFWWVGTFAGLAILTVVLAFNFLGDTLRDRLDPRTRRAT